MFSRLAVLAGLLLGTALLPLSVTAQTPDPAPTPSAPPAKPPAKPPAAPAKPPAAPAKPQAKPTPQAAPVQKPPEPQISPSHLALAREAMLNSGIARSFDAIIPTFAEQIKKNSVTRPELAKDLDDVLKNMQPEMEMQKLRMVDIAATIYARRLSEPELQDVVTFFRSPSGKRYVETQPQVLDELVGAMQDWSQDVSEYMMVRVRAEMGKRGHDMQ